MIQALIYIPQRLLFNIYSFLRHWYFESFLNTSYFMLNVFESLDKTFALEIHLRNLFKPMYQDATIFGYVLGFLFRSSRSVVASVVYLFVFALSVAGYLAWLFLPPYVIYMIFSSHGGQ